MRDEVAQALQRLYDSNRGALYANSLIQAQAAFEEGDFVKALELVEASRESFRVRHKKTLQLDPKRPNGKTRASKKEAAALQAKQEKYNRTLLSFDETLAHLDKMARMQRLASPRSAARPAAPGESPSPGQLPDGFQSEYEEARTEDDRCQVVYRYFDVAPVETYQDIMPAAYYFVRGRESRLVQISAVEPSTELASIVLVPSGQRMKPVPRPRLVELGKKALLLRVTPKDAAAIAADAAKSDEADVAQTPARPERSYLDGAIDMGTFTQLFSAAQQSGIVPGADQIAHVRDREFRMGKYQAALEIIERLYVKFNQELAQRQQKLRAEEMDYRAGTLKMTPKEWQAKKQRETLQTQIIERTRRDFARTLGGLRVLISSK
jgi:hypothetical protein